MRFNRLGTPTDAFETHRHLNATETCTGIKPVPCEKGSTTDMHASPHSLKRAEGGSHHFLSEISCILRIELGSATSVADAVCTEVSD